MQHNIELNTFHLNQIGEGFKRLMQLATPYFL